MQCGICRIPFKLEYFGNDTALIQIYENKMLDITDYYYKREFKKEGLQLEKGISIISKNDFFIISFILSILSPLGIIIRISYTSNILKRLSV